MDFTYHFRQTYLKETKPEEIDSKGLSPHNPSSVFLYEMLIAYLRELSVYLFYLLKLGISNEKIKEDFINSVSAGIINVEYTEKLYKKNF